MNEQHPEKTAENQVAEMGESLWSQVANWPQVTGRLNFFT
jgi:hypothetical protein